MDLFLTDRKFAVGTRLTIADLILLSTVSTLDVVGIDLSAHQHVHNWYENMKSTAPGWEENAKGLEIIKQMTSNMAPPKPAESQEEPVAAAPAVVETPVAEPEPVKEPEPEPVQEEITATSAPTEESTWHPAAASETTSTESHHQQITPLIEVTDSPQSTTEVVTTTTKEVIESEDGVTEVTTEVTETTTITEQVTKVIHLESEVKTELVNGDAPVVVNGVGKYGNDVIF